MIKMANFKEIAEKTAREGVTRRVFSGENSMMVLNTIQSFAQPALHQHPHEQITYILQGECDFTMGEEVIKMKAGDVVLVPPDMPHTLRPTSDETIINFDVFSPIREDYL